MCALARGTRSQWTNWSKWAWGSYWRDGGMRILPFRIGSWDTNHLDPADYGWWNCHENCHESPRAQSHSSCHFQDTENHHKTMLALHRGSLQSPWICMAQSLNLMTLYEPNTQANTKQNNQTSTISYQCSSVAKKYPMETWGFHEWISKIIKHKQKQMHHSQSSLASQNTHTHRRDKNPWVPLPWVSR